MNTQIDFENYKVSNIVIPENGNEFYVMDAEIVFKKNRKIISAILTSLNIEEIIYI
ncbi:MAG TPA: hypothetical protein VFD80_09300 [Flavobacteriaceae bacterium]|nr:hypothetical protein [Flavobacteriaceae bacterium]